MSGVVQVPYRWLDSCQESRRYPTGGWTAVRSRAGTLQVAGQLSGVVQVPYRWLNSCQEWCRYPTGGWTCVRSGAGTLQVAGQLSGVVQVPYRWLDSCQEWCRYLTGAHNICHFRRAHFTEGGSGEAMENQIRQTIFTRLIPV